MEETHTCALEQVNLRACLCAQLVSRFVFLLPRQSYLPRSIFSEEVAAEQHGRDASERDASLEGGQLGD